ncbi:hypothetical protein ACE1B4_14290 [Aeromonas veronii]|uniref:hypothetical protein n=1 Tax=Aeromonas veronii TaxID=654 RepID=UPI001873C582|nr:hypothetical protein [Aeromonas veronii]TNI01501.1 hypothetical protein CF135_21715 [Aeromonas veronii]HDO1310202.1 hypothetical protein [Aeromonas veronii]HDO1318188.1 hypothetical protein [Aeromonas veronii]HDO1330485.1 hypothetical protein [Aeromonas veronii]HDO1332389.1 hypothetical protein [Aeromonas veronii]
MLHHKLIAGEIPDTYLVTELINEEDLTSRVRRGRDHSVFLTGATREYFLRLSTIRNRYLASPS